MTGTDWFLALGIAGMTLLLAQQIWRDLGRWRGDTIRVR